MTKPDKIWAVFKEYRNPKDKVPEVYASASPTKGDEFLLSTPAREHAEELVEALEEYANEENWRLNPTFDVNSPRFDGWSRARPPSQNQGTNR